MKVMIGDTFKCIIAGSRYFDDYELLKEKCSYYLQNKSNIEIVSGGAKGADKLGEQFAKEMGYGLKIFPADWDTYDKAAGPIRNKDMALYADALIAFKHSFISKGTSNMIKQAREHGLKVKVVRIKRDTGDDLFDFGKINKVTEGLI